jgi:hypothetical protein
MSKHLHYLKTTPFVFPYWEMKHKTEDPTKSKEQLSSLPAFLLKNSFQIQYINAL